MTVSSGFGEFAIGLLQVGTIYVFAYGLLVAGVYWAADLLRRGHE